MPTGIGPLSSYFNTPGRSSSASRNGLSPAGQALGLGNNLQQQVDDETERKKRLLQQQQQAFSPATMSLLGMNFGV
jgi:hypothetical protein